MRRRLFPVIGVILVVLALAGCGTGLPEGFVYVHEVIDTVQLDIRYYGENNFVGTRIDGYERPVAILSEEAAAALKVAADILEEQGYYIKIFDAYRPQMAVDHFIRWAQDLDDVKMKEQFYPDGTSPSSLNWATLPKNGALPGQHRGPDPGGQAYRRGIGHGRRL